MKEIMSELQSYPSEKYKENVVRLGIPRESSMGVPMISIRKMARKVNKNNQLAWQLWETDYHEAKLLATFLSEVNKLTYQDINRLMSDVISWDLCDHLCKELIFKLHNYLEFVLEWVKSSKIYYKRAAFTLIATSVIHEKDIHTETMNVYLSLISNYSQDSHVHVKKAVAWALREIGKRNFEDNKKALQLAYEFKSSDDKAQIWIGKNVIKKIAGVIKVTERLISANTKTGKTQK